MNPDKLFCFEKTDDGYVLTNYLQRINFDIENIKIPSEYNGEPVVSIGKRAFHDTCLDSVNIPESVVKIEEYAFYMSFTIQDVNIPDHVIEIGTAAFAACRLRNIEFPEGLKNIEKGAFRCNYDLLTKIVLPKSLEYLGDRAFDCCDALSSVTFLNPHTKLGTNVFNNCPKLPAETVLMGLVGSTDISRPLSPYVFTDKTGLLPQPNVERELLENLLREDVFELAVKNGCFRNANEKELFLLFKVILDNDLQSRFLRAAESGLIISAELADTLIGYSAERKKTEFTAWLLEYKNRRIGYDKGNKYDL